MKGPFDNFLSGQASYYVLLASALLFIASISVGAWAKRNVLNAMRLKRQQMAMALLQKGILMAMERIDDDLSVIHAKIQRREYLGDELQAKERNLEKQDTGLIDEMKLIRLQEKFLAVAYFSMLLIALPRPPA